MIATDTDFFTPFNTGGILASRFALENTVRADKSTLSTLNTLVSVKRDFWHTSIAEERIGDIVKDLYVKSSERIFGARSVRGLQAAFVGATPPSAPYC